MADYSVLIVLHVTGLDADPKDIVARHGLVADRIWRKGEPPQRRFVHPDSGFSLAVGDADSTAAVHRALSDHLHRHSAFYDDVRSSGGHCFFDLGVMVPASSPRTVTLEPELLAKLADRDIAVNVTSYPVSDDIEDSPSRPTTA